MSHPLSIDISYIIVTYNSERFIDNCLSSVVSQKREQIDSEIIVIDNASTDSTVEILKNRFPNILLKKNPENIGFAVAVNQAFSLSNGKYIILLNPDTVIEDKFSEKIFYFLKATPRVSILGVKLIDSRNEHQPSVWKKISTTTVIFEMLLPYTFSVKLVTESPVRPCQVLNVSGACMLIRRDVFEKLEGFDTRFFLYYEEIDFCLRAREKGYEVYYNPDIEVVHHFAKSSFQNDELFFLNLYENKLLLIEKHFGYTFYLFSFNMVLVGISLRIIISFLGGLLTFKRRLLRLSKSLIFVLINIIKSRYR
jgi:GT2 family glycosyltransferase